jgi:hypothetical protein
VKKLDTNDIGEWKKDSTLHTAEGLDALKQRLDALYPESPMQRQAQRAITSVRNAVKDTIVSQDKNSPSTTITSNHLPIENKYSLVCQMRSAIL